MNVLVIHDHNYDTRIYVLDRTLKCLRDAGHRVFVITPDAPIYNRLRYSRNYHKWMTYDIQSDIAIINAYCRRRAIDVIVPADIGSTLMLAQHTDEITTARVFPLAKHEDLLLLHNKGSFMQWLKEHDLPQPETQLISSDTVLDTLDIRYPLIAKPLEDCAGHGVQRIDSLSDLHKYNAEHWRHNTDPFLIQTFISGNDLVFGVFAEHGHIRAWTMQTFRPRKGNQLEHLEYIEYPELLHHAEQIVHILQYHGVAEFDVRLDEDGQPWFIECNPRLWASITISMHMGVNYADLGIRLAMGQPLPGFQPVTGQYVWPERALARLVRREVRLSELSQQNRHGLIAEISDPIPFAYLVYDWWNNN
jgi:predicted ATP-grasp superfamily ATP-dependent carboligase